MSSPDPGRSRAWAASTTSALNKWRQGHIFEGLPVVALRLQDTDTLWVSAERAQLHDGFAVAGEDPSMLRHAMVVSQGCEIVKQNYPCATVVPVYEASQVLDNGTLGNTRAGRVYHLVHLTAPWTRAGFWVADLRFEFALDKSVLETKTPLEAFDKEEQYPQLAQRLAVVRQRPAVPQPTIDHVVVPLEQSVQDELSSGQDPLQGVREIRLSSNDPTAPTVVTIFVVSEDAGTPDLMTSSRIVGSVQAVAAAHGIAVAGPEIASLWEMTAADYLLSQAVDAASSS